MERVCLVYGSLECWTVSTWESNVMCEPSPHTPPTILSRESAEPLTHKDDRHVRVSPEMIGPDKLAWIEPCDVLSMDCSRPHQVTGSLPAARPPLASLTSHDDTICISALTTMRWRSNEMPEAINDTDPHYDTTGSTEACLVHLNSNFTTRISRASSNERNFTVRLYLCMHEYEKRETIVWVTGQHVVVHVFCFFAFHQFVVHGVRICRPCMLSQK